MKFQNFGTLHALILRIHFGTPRNFGHFNATYMVSHKVNYKGRSGDFFQGQVMSM
jgi:hypothetical protein